MDVSRSPLRRPFPPASAPAASRASETRGPTCLLAHSDAEDIKRITVNLRRALPGFRVEAVYSAEEVLSWAPRDDWHLLVLSERLAPDGLGQLVARLKADLPDTGIVVLADGGQGGNATTAARAGADCYLPAAISHADVELPLILRLLLDRRELRLRTERERLRSAGLWNLLQQPALELDADGRVSDANPALLLLARSTLDELRGLPLSGLLQGADGSSWHRWLKESRAGGAPDSRLTVLMASARDGTATASEGVTLEIVGLYGGGGRFLGAVGVGAPIGPAPAAAPTRDLTRVMGDLVSLVDRLSECRELERRARGEPASRKIAAAVEALKDLTSHWESEEARRASGRVEGTGERMAWRGPGKEVRHNGGA